MRDHCRRLTALPKSCWAIWTIFPNLNRIRHSSTLNSKTSVPSSLWACHSKLCCTSASIDARAIRGLSWVYRSICGKESRPRVRRTDTTCCDSIRKVVKQQKWEVTRTAARDPKCTWTISVHNRAKLTSAITEYEYWCYWTFFTEVRLLDSAVNINNFQVS